MQLRKMRRKGRGLSSRAGLLLLFWLLALRVSASEMMNKTTNHTDTGKVVDVERVAKNIGLEAIRKVDPYFVWNTTTGTGLNLSTKNITQLDTAGTSIKATVVKPRYRASLHSSPKYPPALVHYAEKQQLQLPPPLPPSPSPLPHDNLKSYSTTEDYEHKQHDYNQQVQSYGIDYYAADNQEYNYTHNQNHEYEDSYNTIPEDQNHSGYDGVIKEPVRVAYIKPDPGYFGPPIIAQDPPIQDLPLTSPPAGVVSVRECNCPDIRTYQCESPSNNFVNLLWALGGNLWDLIQLIATSSLPFLIPLLAIKMIIVPLKILKFIKLIKLFVKFFIILPFFMRVVYPAISNSFDLHGFLFQKIQNTVPSNSHPAHVHHPHNAESRDDANASSSSSSSAEYILDGTWDLHACPSRVSCEFGSFLANSLNNHFPTKLMDYLKKRADNVEGKSLRVEEGDGDEDEEEEDDDNSDEKDSMMQRSEAFKAFLVALGKKWTQEQCEVYSCAVLL